MKLRSLDASRLNRLESDWDTLEIRVPWFIGRRFVDADPKLLLQAVDLTGPLAAFGAGAPAFGTTDVQDRAVRLLAKRGAVARGVYGFWPANSTGDDIAVYRDDSRARELVRFHTLRQQVEPDEGKPNMALADFIAPQESFAPDYIGAFAVTVTLGLDAGGQPNHEGGADPQERFIAALASALARVFALRVQEDLRRDWGQRSPALDAPRSRDSPGLCVRFGEPAAPDPTENAALLRLLHGAELGLSLDGAGNIQPHSSVCGLCFSHPQAVAFELGPVGEDQLEDYAARKEISRAEAEEILSAVRTPDV